METGKSTKTIGSVEKTVRILNIVGESEAGLGATEISRAIGCGVSATYHLLNTLRQNDLLQQDPQNKRYCLGVGIFRLSALAQRQNTLTSAAQPYLDALSDACGETSNLVILRDREIIYLAQREGSSMVKLFTRLGARVPFYCTGGGKVILAFLPRAVQEAHIRDTKLVAFTPHTITRRAELLRELDCIRQQGYAYDRGEREEGVLCIAAPVFNAAGEPMAATSLSGPAYRLEAKGLETLTGRVVESAAALSLRMGWNGK